MGEIKFTFNSAGAQFEANASGIDMLKAITILCNSASCKIPKSAVMAAVFAWLDESTFRQMATEGEPIGDGVSISSDLAELLRGLKGE